MPEGISGRDNVKALTEMCAAMDELRHHKQTLEDDVHKIIQSQQKFNPLEQMKLLDHQPLSCEIWWAHVLEGFKPPSLAKFDGRSNPYK